MTVFHWLALAAVWLTGCITLALWLQGRWRLVAGEMAALRRDIATLKKDQAVAMKGSYGMGQRMLRLERRLKAMAAEPPPQATEEPEEQPFSYTQAAQMVEQGADVESIAATCGLSHSEAHLMQKLCTSEASLSEPTP